MSLEEPKLNHGLVATQMSRNNADVKEIFDSWRRHLYCKVGTSGYCDCIPCECHFCMLDITNIEMVYFVYGCFACLCLCTTGMPGIRKGQKRRTRVTEGCELWFTVGSVN